MSERPETPYHNASCNIGLELSRLTGGNLGHRLLRSPEGIVIGDSYGVNRITKFPNPEQFDAQIDSFLVRQGFRRAENQPVIRITTIAPDGEQTVTDREEFTKSGSLRAYIHPETPLQEYIVSLGISHKLKMAAIEVILHSQ